MMKRYVLVGLLAAGLLAACGDDDDNGNNGVAQDVGVDAQADVGVDVAPDTGPTGDGNDSPGEAMPLAVGDDVTDTISDRGADASDDDFFAVEVAPGQTIRVEATADGDMQPSVTAFYSVQQQVFPFAFGRPVDGGGEAAIEFTHPSTFDESLTYYILVADARNLPLEQDVEPENVGGETFGYTLSTSEITWTPTAASLPLEESGSIAEVGNYAWYEFDVPASSILALEASTEAANFSPFVALLAEGGEALVAGPSGAALTDAQATVVGGVRDELFRGGAGFDFTANFGSVSFADVTFTEVAETEPNDAADSAQDLTDSLPAAVTGTIEGTNTTDFNQDFFDIPLEAGDTLGFFTEGGADDQTNDADTVLAVLDSEGNEVYFNDDYLLQTDTFFSAGAVTVDTAGTYTLVIEPYCTDESCDGGDYTANIFVESPVE